MKKHDISRLLLFAGILWIVLGFVPIISPGLTYLVIVRYSGVILLLDGILWLSLCLGAESSARERNWRMMESVVDIAFSTILLLDPLFALFAFPFVVVPWMAAKGVLKMISSLTLTHRVHGWTGDLIAGMLLILFGILIPCDPMDNAFGVTTIITAIGWTLGAQYLFDYFRTPGHRPFHLKF